MKSSFVDGKVKKARLYICGLGLYEAYLNGVQSGDGVLASFLNDDNCALQVQTYDITNMLGQENICKIYLGNGWYKGRFGFKDQPYGDKFSSRQPKGSHIQLDVDEVKAKDFVGYVIYSDMECTGYLETDNKKANRLELMYFYRQRTEP